MLLQPLEHARQGLVGGRLVGFNGLDYGPVEHTFTPDELALAAGAAQLVALVLQREQLLREREEARANALALRETNRRMDEFLAVAAHELRAPVMTTLLAVEQAQRSAQGLSDRTPVHEDEASVKLVELQRHLAHADDSVERLRHLIADLLDLSRTHVGQLDVHPEPADLAAILSDAVARQRVLDPTRTIHLQLPTTVPIQVMADAVRISQVVANYLGNALKYSPGDRAVEVGLRVHGGRARVSVRDQGPGLPSEEQRRIWERYHQVPGIRANAGTSVGLGLGLYLSREIVTVHGGRVGVRSAPGKGSTFWFTLPLDHTRT
jgi:signal transduction histidine kinase